MSDANALERAYRRAGNAADVSGRDHRDAEPDHHRAVAEIDRLTRQVAELKRTPAGGREQRARPGERTAAALLKCKRGRKRRPLSGKHRELASAVHREPDPATATATIAAPHDRRDLLGAAAARRVVSGVVEFGLHRAGPSTMSAENAADLVPQRRRFRDRYPPSTAPVAPRSRDRRPGSYRPDRFSSFSWISRSASSGFAGIGGVLVMRCRIEFLSHGVPPWLG